MTAEAGERAPYRNTRFAAGLDLLLVRSMRAGYDSGLDAGRASSVFARGRVEAHRRIVSTTTVPLPPLEDATPRRTGLTALWAEAVRVS